MPAGVLVTFPLPAPDSFTVSDDTPFTKPWQPLRSRSAVNRKTPAKSLCIGKFGNLDVTRAGSVGSLLLASSLPDKDLSPDGALAPKKPSTKHANKAVAMSLDRLCRRQRPSSRCD